MTKLPMMTGDRYNDIVTWRWDRPASRWVAKLKDGTELRAQFVRNGGRYSERNGVKVGHWRAHVIDHEYRQLPNEYAHPDLAEQAAFDDWKRRSVR